MIIAAFALAASAAAASAEPARDVPSTTVPFSAAELETEAGVSALHERIAHAAEMVCAEANFNRLDRRWCERRALDAAVQDADLPALSRYHASDVAERRTVVSMR
jgi:UrcA family protein